MKKPNLEQREKENSFKAVRIDLFDKEIQRLEEIYENETNPNFAGIILKDLENKKRQRQEFIENDVNSM